MKSFSEFIKEDTTTAAVPGAGDDSSTVIVRRKRKRQPVTKHYIEVNGKIKKTSKNLY